MNTMNNIYHITIKMDPIHVTFGTYIDFGTENNEKDPKLEVGDHVRTSKHGNIFAKDYTQNWSEKVFGNKKRQIYCVVDICKRRP